MPNAMTRAAAAFFAITTWTIVGTGPGAAAGSDIAHFHLANGLEVVVIPDHRTPVVTHMLWYAERNPA